jgi:hypothetical protein
MKKIVAGVLEIACLEAGHRIRRGAQALNDGRNRSLENAPRSPRRRRPAIEEFLKKFDVQFFQNGAFRRSNRNRRTETVLQDDTSSLALLAICRKPLGKPATPRHQNDCKTKTYGKLEAWPCAANISRFTQIR